MISKLYKIAIAGEGATGTVSILRRYLEGKFSPDYRPGHGALFGLANIKETVRGESIKILAYPRPRYHAFPDQYQLRGWFRGMKGLVLIYDITRMRTFEELPEWLDRALSYSTDFPVAIVGNKVDLVGEKIEERNQYSAGPDNIDSSYGATLAENISNEYDIPTLFMETSAKTGHNIQHLFSEFAEIVANHWRRDRI